MCISIQFSTWGYALCGIHAVTLLIIIVLAFMLAAASLAFFVFLKLNGCTMAPVKMINEAIEGALILVKDNGNKELCENCFYYGLNNIPCPKKEDGGYKCNKNNSDNYIYVRR